MINIKQYKESALKTIKPHDSKELAISDWALGLGGESSEVLELIVGKSTDKMEIAKELGDVLWYVVALAGELNIELDEDILKSHNTILLNAIRQSKIYVDQDGAYLKCFQLSVAVGTIQEKIKHIIMHKEESDTSVIKAELQNIIYILTYLSMYEKFTIFAVADLNVAKLAHRYNIKHGGKYSVEASADRHDTELAFESTEEFKQLQERIVGKC